MLSKVFKYSLQLAVMCVFSIQVYADEPVTPPSTSGEYNDKATLIKDYISDFPNEIISVQGLEYAMYD
jgi:hypothetical protein